LLWLSTWNSRVPGLSGDALRRRSKKWGPSARTCVELEQNTAAGADLFREWRARIAATTFVYNFHRRDVLDMNDVLCHPLAIRPKGLEAPQRTTMITEVPTDHLNQIIAETTAVAVGIERAKFYDAISRNRSFTSLAGYIFEIFFCAWFLGRRESPTLRCSPPPSTWWSRSGLQVVPVCNEVHRVSDMTSLNEVDRSIESPCWMVACFPVVRHC
jgi:hypothetical protein